MTLAKGHLFPFFLLQSQFIVSLAVFFTILMVTFNLRVWIVCSRCIMNKTRKRAFSKIVIHGGELLSLDFFFLFFALTLVNTKSNRDHQGHFHKGISPYSCMLSFHCSHVIFALNCS